MSRTLHREISRRWFRIGAYDEQMVKNRPSRSARTAAFVAAREITPQPLAFWTARASRPALLTSKTNDVAAVSGTGMGVVRVLRPAVDVVVRAELARQVALLRAPAIHSAVGCAVTPSHKIWHRPAPLPCSG